MEQVLSGLIIDISAVQGCSGVNTWFINVIATEKERNRITLREKDMIVKIKFFLLAFAWWTPSAVSTLNTLVFAAVRTGCKLVAFPETAANGETFAAFFAGERDANSTVNIPMIIPATILGILILNIGIVAKNPGLRKRKSAHNIHIITIPVIIPAGIAKRHQLRASLRTNFIICFGVAPTQRISPKNSVLWATLLFKLLVIIIMPADKTSRNRINAER